jgi:hypothetical protein
MNRRLTDTYLSSAVTVSQYLALEKGQCRDEIAEFVYERFTERYVRPFDDKATKNGFAMMASACLMIEALESFWQGWAKSPNSALAFCQFFDRNDTFQALRGDCQKFYVNVRCGILHQGETTDGWHIRRDLSSLFEPATTTIDATRFLKEMDRCLADYCDLLRNSEWNSDVWEKFRKKMNAVCKNAERGA